MKTGVWRIQSTAGHNDINKLRQIAPFGRVLRICVVFPGCAVPSSAAEQELVRSHMEGKNPVVYVTMKNAAKLFKDDSHVMLNFLYPDYSPPVEVAPGYCDASLRLPSCVLSSSRWACSEVGCKKSYAAKSQKYIKNHMKWHVDEKDRAEKSRGGSQGEKGEEETGALTWSRCFYCDRMLVWFEPSISDAVGGLFLSGSMLVLCSMSSFCRKLSLEPVCLTSSSSFEVSKFRRWQGDSFQTRSHVTNCHSINHTNFNH